MAVKTVCPHCSQSYSLADIQVGRKVRCKSCAEPFVVEEEAPRKAPRRRDDEDEERPERRPARRPKKGLPGWLWVVGGLAVAVVLLGCLGVGGGLLWYFTRTKVTEENYARIKKGMSEAEVKGILGEPNGLGDANTDSNIDNINKGMGARLGLTVQAWSYKKDRISVVFLGGKVFGKVGQFSDGKGGLRVIQE